MQQTISLPKLRKINVDRPKKKKIFLLSDDIVLTSGISTMSRELVLGTLHHYDWVQLSAALHHPENGKIIDMSEAFEKETGLSDLYMIRYCSTGYGEPNQIREIIQRERPNAIMIFTDPRHWMRFWPLEHELHTIWQLPIIYINVWDLPPAPMYNYPYYRSCDLILNISKQTQSLVSIVLGKEGEIYE